MNHTPTTITKYDINSHYSTCENCGASIARFAIEDCSDVFTQWCVNEDWGSPVCEERKAIMFEYAVISAEGEFYTLITAGDPSDTFPNALSITTLGEYNPSTTKNEWVLA